MYKCMDVPMDGCTHLWMYPFMDVPMYGCSHGWMYPCLHWHQSINGAIFAHSIPMCVTVSAVQAAFSRFYLLAYSFPFLVQKQFGLFKFDCPLSFYKLSLVNTDFCLYEDVQYQTLQLVAKHISHIFIFEWANCCSKPSCVLQL